jgi:succinate dehydrogenase/fumarate reductase flavoprotein subunit
VSDLVIAGAGMAGLVAAAHALAEGAQVDHYEKGDAPGGAMLLSSGVIWRHSSFEDFRAECPDGDPELQRLIFDRLDADLEWLESLGAPVVARETPREHTTGVRFDPPGLTRALAHDGIRFGEPLRELPEGPVILATGGFAASRGMVARWITREPLRLRSHPRSTGDGIALGLAAGGELASGMDQFYGRVMPDAEWGPEDFVAQAQLWADRARVTGSDGERFEPRAWHQNDVVQWLARRPGARGTFDDTPVVASITTTLGGLRGPDVAPGVWAAGQDVGAVATGGYSSGLAAALVLGRVAAERALA